MGAGMTIADIELAGGARTRIRSFGVRAYPDEGCGVLIGRFDGRRAVVVDATSGKNTNTQRSRDRYVLDPADIVHADRDARARALDIVGFWHSHPDHPARPSQFDTDHAWVDYVYIIVNTTVDGAGDLNGFTLVDEGGMFEQLPLAEIPGSEPCR
jgi:proteasome lid subunit RPN8/RPN11